jgi:hypothetical protein
MIKQSFAILLLFITGLLFNCHTIFSQTVPVKSNVLINFKDETNEQNSNYKISDDNKQAYTPLTKGQKLKHGFKSAFLSPEGYLFTGISSAITQATEKDQPHKTTEDKMVDGLSRFAIKFSTRSTKSIFGSGIYPVLFKQDPRYHQSNKKGFGARALYAASRVFITKSDDGNSVPNYSRLGGMITASALSNLWERNTPGRDRIGVGPTFTRFGSMVGFDMVQTIIFKEFWPDIKRKVFRK